MSASSMAGDRQATRWSLIRGAQLHWSLRCLIDPKVVVDRNQVWRPGLRLRMPKRGIVRRPPSRAGRTGCARTDQGSGTVGALERGTAAATVAVRSDGFFMGRVSGERESGERAGTLSPPAGSTRSVASPSRLPSEAALFLNIACGIDLDH
jgi:hypothetical protein